MRSRSESESNPPHRYDLISDYVATDSSNRGYKVTMATAFDHLSRIWITAGSSELWDCPGTYGLVPYELLPNLQHVDADFSWLQNAPDRSFDSTLSRFRIDLAHMDRILQHAHTLQLQLPRAFVRFMRNSQLHRRVPTCTNCGLDLSDAIVDCPWEEPAYALRFLQDSQSCVMWYLLLRPRMDTAVVASHYFLEPDIFVEMEYEDEGMTYERAFANLYLCADTFQEFIYRFWIENSIWYSLQDGHPLSKREADYKQSISRKP